MTTQPQPTWTPGDPPRQGPLGQPGPGLMPLSTWAVLARALAELVRPQAPPAPFVPECCERPSPGNYWAALGRAQKAAQELDPKGEVSHGSTQYNYAGYRQYIKEARRVLHAEGLLVQQTGSLSPENDKRRRTSLGSHYTVVHESTGEGVCYPFDWCVSESEKWPAAKATGASYSNSLRYFLRGLLQIIDKKGDRDDPESMYDGGRQQSDPYAGANPHWPGQQQQPYHDPQQQQQAWNPRSWNQQDQGGPPQQPYQQPPYASGQEQGGWPQQGQQQFPDGHSVQQGQQGQQGQRVPQGQSPHGGDGNLGYLPDQGQQFNNGLAVEQESPPPVWDPSSGQEPSGSDEWKAALIWAGHTEAFATDLALQQPDEQIHDGARVALGNEIEKFFGTGEVDAQRATDAWEGTGFVPDFTQKPMPRPTGVQACRYVLNRMNKTNAPARAGGAR